MDRLLPLRGLAMMMILVIGFVPPAQGQASSADDSAQDDRERKVMERFLGLLEKTPRRGTPLDKVYGYHVERGTLDAFLKTYQDRVAKDPKDGVGWMILGLMESQRGRDATAVADLRQAEEVRPDDPLASYYLGQALVLVGQPDAAAEAFERAIARKPARADLLEVYQALGRVHQRAHHNDKALAVWTRLEKQFPDDLRVQEQIATALAEESDPAQALPRYEALAKKTTDAYRKIQFRMDAADLKVRLGKQAEALKDFESLLSQLNPDGWLYREVRRRIEEVFLKNDDQAGLATYYEKWVNTNPEDVDAMSRLGRTLALQGRAAESRAWFEKAVKLAPSRRELRLALVEQLVQDKKIAEAAAQYEALAKADPGNPDTLRDWGRILLRDESKPEADRKKAAAAVWNKLVQARPKDAATAVQVADLLRQAEMPEEAIALYKKAIALAPDSAQYREYLTEEAIAMLWRGFDKSPDLESRLGIVARLTNLYMQQNQFDRLITRLERAGREADRQRETTICRATAYSTSGDYGTARQELERLLTANTRDTQLLTQLAALAETEGDWETAAKYQKQLYEIAPNDEHAAKLAPLYLGAGAIAEAEALWSKMAGGESDEFRVLQASDSLLAHHKEGEVLAIADRLLRQRPDDWEALYRAGVALACQDQPAEATRRFQALLALTLADETESLIVKARKKNAGKSGAPVAPARPNAIRAVPLQLRIRTRRTSSPAMPSPRPATPTPWPT